MNIIHSTFFFLIFLNNYFQNQGTLTAAFQVFLGLHAGIIMMTYKDWKERVIRWLAWAAFLGCVGCVLHFTNVIPVNKKLWYVSKKGQRRIDYIIKPYLFAIIYAGHCHSYS